MRKETRTDQTSQYERWAEKVLRTSSDPLEYRATLESGRLSGNTAMMALVELLESSNDEVECIY